MLRCSNGEVTLGLAWRFPSTPEGSKTGVLKNVKGLLSDYAGRLERYMQGYWQNIIKGSVCIIEDNE